MGIAAALISAAAATALGGAITATGFFSSVFVSFLARAALGIALNALTPKPKSKGSNRGYQVTTRGSALDHQIIYGRMRVGGVVVHEETSAGTNRLHRVIAFAGHEVESFDEVWFDDTKIVENGSPVNDTQYGPIGLDSDGGGSLSAIRIDRFNGSPNQLASQYMIDFSSVGWSSAHRLRGIAYLVVTTFFDKNKFPNGIPEVTATIKGKKVYDPRDTTTAWSDNPALCLRDYLTSGYGLGEDSTAIDDALVSDAADVCDETDTLNSEKRYTCNGAFVTQVTPYDILGDLLTSMGGLLWFAQGEWRMKPAYYVAPTITLTEDDLRSSIAVKTRHTRRDNYNTVRGTFRGEESNWQVTDYPDVTNSAFLAADNNQESVIDLELPFTDNSEEARRIARIALERNRQQLTVSAAFGLRAFSVQTGDIIQLSISRFGWDEKEFEVTNWTFGLTDDQDLQVNMTLREISESVFDEVDDGIVYERDNTSLLSPFDVPGIGLSVGSKAKIIREKLLNSIDILVSTAEDERVDYVEVEYKPSSETEWENVGSGAVGRYEVLDVEPGPHDVRARAVNTFGVRGEWETALSVDINAFAGSPSNVSNFNYEVVDSTLNLFWDAIPDPDLSHYQIRFVPITSGASWANATTAVEKVARPSVSVSLPVRSGSYLIRAIDKGGIPSQSSTTVVIQPEELPSFTTTLTQTEDSTFSGTKTNLIVDGSRLRLPLVASNLITNGTFDTDLSGWDTIGNVTQSSGEALISLSDVQTFARLRQDFGGFSGQKTLTFDITSASGNISGVPVIARDTSGSLSPRTLLILNSSFVGSFTLSIPEEFDSVGFDVVNNFGNSEISVDNVVVGASIDAGDTGTYEFSDVIDTGAVRRVWSYIKAPNVRVNDSAGEFDDMPGLFDSALGLFDDAGGGANLGDTNIKFFISTTEDDPTGTPTWSDWKQFRAGSFYGRAFKYKLEMSTSSAQTTPSLTELDAVVEYN